MTWDEKAVKALTDLCVNLDFTYDEFFECATGVLVSEETAGRLKELLEEPPKESA